MKLIIKVDIAKIKNYGYIYYEWLIIISMIISIKKLMNIKMTYKILYLICLCYHLTKNYSGTLYNMV